MFLKISKQRHNRNDPLAMPANLRKAHNDLDRAVDRLYRSKPFEDDAERVAMLLKMYQKLTRE